MKFDQYTFSYPLKWQILISTRILMKMNSCQHYLPACPRTGIFVDSLIWETSLLLPLGMTRSMTSSSCNNSQIWKRLIKNLCYSESNTSVTVYMFKCLIRLSMNLAKHDMSKCLHLWLECQESYMGAWGNMNSHVIVTDCFIY